MPGTVLLIGAGNEAVKQTTSSFPWSLHVNYSTYLLVYK